MIAEENGIDYALLTYASIIFFLADTYEIEEESEKFDDLEIQIATLIKNSKIVKNEHELELAIIVFILIESQASESDLESSLKIFTDLLLNNNISEALQLERFLCLDESIAHEELVRTIKERKIDLNFDLSKTSLAIEDGNIILEQDGKMLTIKY